MKKLVFSLSIVCFSAAAFAQKEKMPKVSTMPAAAAPASTLTADNIEFKADSYDFGNLTEGAPAEHVFTFKNTGKEPILVQRVQASCGCTTPDWSKEPIAPGKTGVIKASYGTQGRPGAFTKTLTVFSNAGTKMLTIKGSVDKAPETSVPQNNSMMRTN